MIAPLASTLTGSSSRRSAGGDERHGALDVLDHGERRVGEDTERHERHPQQATERTRHVWSEHAAEAHRGDRHADAPSDVAGRVLDLGERAAELARRCDGGRLVRAGRRPAGPPVDLDPLRTTIDSRAGLSAAAPSVEIAASDVSGAPSSGWPD